MTKKLDAILIDDDEDTHFIWERAAEFAGGSFLGFRSSADFFERIDMLDRTVPVYIDSDLKEADPGEVIAKAIKAHGFETIFLQTAIPVSDPTGLEWITAVLGKDTPWDDTLEIP